MSKIECEIQGESPLLMNRFTEESAAKVSAGTSAALQIGKRGTPREQAEPKLYTCSDGRPMIPGANILRGIVDAGQFHKAGRKAITNARSSLIPSGIQIYETECVIANPFSKEVVWEVDSRSVVLPSTGGRIMCHRPRFDAWKVPFTLKVDDEMFSENLVRALVDDLGTKIGLGDFRPARKGPFGRFFVTTWKVVPVKTPKEVAA